MSVILLRLSFLTFLFKQSLSTPFTTLHHFPSNPYSHYHIPSSHVEIKSSTTPSRLSTLAIGFGVHPSLRSWLHPPLHMLLYCYPLTPFLSQFWLLYDLGVTVHFFPDFNPVPLSDTISPSYFFTPTISQSNSVFHHAQSDHLPSLHHTFWYSPYIRH